MGTVIAKDALDRFEISRQYKQHLDAVANDRQLEKFFEDSGVGGLWLATSNSQFLGSSGPAAATWSFFYYLCPYGYLAEFQGNRFDHIVYCHCDILNQFRLLAKDGMDQSKWCIPRSKVLTKSLFKHERPKTKIQGVWVHNICLCLFVLDPRMQADGSTIIETLYRALDKAHQICASHGKKMPPRLLLWEPWNWCQQSLFDLYNSSL